MGLFDTLFGSRKPAPLFEIHERDRDLVRQSDIDWWDTLTLKDCIALEKQDDVFKLAAFTKYMKEDGLDGAAAAKKLRLRFLYYYLLSADRSDSRFSLDDKDVSLPYPLKDRINRAMMTGKITKADMENTSSLNALIRDRIRTGLM